MLLGHAAHPVRVPGKAGDCSKPAIASTSIPSDPCSSKWYHDSFVMTSASLSHALGLSSAHVGGVQGMAEGCSKLAVVLISTPADPCTGKLHEQVVASKRLSVTWSGCVSAAQLGRRQGRAGVFSKLSFMLGPKTGASISPDQLRDLLTCSGGNVLLPQLPTGTGTLVLTACSLVWCTRMV